MNNNICDFIAPNGARVTIKDWKTTVARFSTPVVMQVIFNDPLLSEDAR